MVIEQISSEHVYQPGLITAATDCAGNQLSIDVAPGPVGTGNGAKLTANGTIDFTQSYAGVTPNYAMKYLDCSSAGGIQTTYDVRWNVMSVSTNTSSVMITAAARPLSSNVNQLGGLFFALPVNLRSIAAPGAMQ
jgi:hypothetical protein